MSTTPNNLPTHVRWPAMDSHPFDKTHKVTQERTLRKRGIVLQTTLLHRTDTRPS